MADQGIKLAGGLSVPLIFDYVDSSRVRKIHHITLRALFWRETLTLKAPRVDLKCISSTERQPRTFHAQRVIFATDLRTGEIFDDPTELFSEIISSAGGKQPPSWPDETNRARCPTPELDENDFLAGWHFGLPKAFLAALDIKWENLPNGRGTVLTEGIPRAYDFHTGDTLYSPPIKRGVWGEEVLKLKQGIQVIAATPDTIVNRRKTSGTVEADLWDFVSGQIENKRRITLPQEQFVELLRAGPAA